MSIDHNQIRRTLKTGDVILYRSAYNGWRSAVVTKPNPTFIMGPHDERIYYKRIEGVGRDLESAQATVKLLRAESEQHYANDRAERDRHIAAIAAILEAAA